MTSSDDEELEAVTAISTELIRTSLVPPRLRFMCPCSLLCNVEHIDVLVYACFFDYRVCRSDAVNVLVVLTAIVSENGAENMGKRV